MSIIVGCECGKRFRAKDEHAGKRAKCPACGRVLVIGASGATRTPRPTPLPTDEEHTCVVCGEEIPPDQVTAGQKQVICRQCLGDAPGREPETKGFANAARHGEIERAPQILPAIALVLTVSAYCFVNIWLAAAFADLPEPGNVAGPVGLAALVVGLTN